MTGFGQINQVEQEGKIDFVWNVGKIQVKSFIIYKYNHVFTS